ncbi:hypothetical protein FWG95_03340, partial [Candidatus Saccharibacteria bacterium]|nr:hypothetical protein [Candidatus Saccharibacteria bacterium]
MTKTSDEPDNVNEQLAKLLEKQISLSEWLAGISHKATEKIRAEDNEKRETLRQLNEIVSLPYDAPMKQFVSADELTGNNPEFENFLCENGDRHCALRLVPLEKNLPKLRMRGRTVAGAMDWFREQKIDTAKYRVDFMSHPVGEAINSTIFVIRKNGVFGEIIRGGHDQLSQGFYRNDNRPSTFSFNFKTWEIASDDEELLASAKKIVELLKINNAAKRKKLSEKFNAEFANNYLCGYFETVDNEGLQFLDWSRSLGKIYEDFVVKIEKNTAVKSNAKVLHGRAASTGIVSGPVKIVESATDDFSDGAVLVAEVTTPDL